ncbi:ABC transporter ATP-binding protein [Streptomyces hygroscopicus]|uniref:ABC transporter ATP-binding protein n=1 Tax=Streptomyces hygroscopicus TaxID=1912 RepID=UPI003F1936F5
MLRKFLAFAALFLVVNSVTVLAGLGVLFLIDPWLALVGLAGAAPLLLVSYFYETRYKVAARATQDEGGHLATLVEETMLGIRVVRAYGQGRGRLALFRTQAERLRTAELRVVRIMAALSTALLVLPELGIAGQLGLGAVGVANSTLTLGDLVAAVTVSTYLRWPTECIGWALAETSTAAAACDRYWEVRDTPPGLTDPAHPKPLVRPARGHLRLEHVEFRHPGADRPVLREVSLELRPGETVALVGATGSGKTTLAALVPRLADVTSGRVTVDGVDVRELRLADLRSVVGCAFDDPLLSSLTVRENVTLGAPEATDEAVWEALRVAGAADFVAALGPDGLAVRIGEQGMSLSGGQRQRIALARAIVGQPALLVLDDPLSALDLHTEAEVEQALRRVLRRSTALVVAHRPNTARMADRVVLLEDGRITAQGTHRELLTSSAAYRALMAVEPRPAGDTPDGVVVR